jgi:hypothetical protein
MLEPLYQLPSSILKLPFLLGEGKAGLRAPWMDDITYDAMPRGIFIYLCGPCLSSLLRERVWWAITISHFIRGPLALDTDSRILLGDVSNVKQSHPMRARNLNDGCWDWDRSLLAFSISNS